MDKRKQAYRRALILYRLRMRGMQTVQELRQYLDTEKIGTAPNTIRRDLRALAAAGKVACKPKAVIGHEYGGGRNVSYDGWAAVEEGT